MPTVWNARDETSDKNLQNAYFPFVWGPISCGSRCRHRQFLKFHKGMKRAIETGVHRGPFTPGFPWNKTSSGQPNPMWLSAEPCLGVVTSSRSNKSNKVPQRIILLGDREVHWFTCITPAYRFKDFSCMTFIRFFGDFSINNSDLIHPTSKIGF